MRLLLLLSFFLQVPFASAEVKPFAEWSIEPSTVVVGEELTLSVKVLVPTWMTKPPLFPDIEIEGVSTVLPPDSTYSTSEEREGGTWAGVVREYKLYPLEPRDFKILEKSLQVFWSDPSTRDSREASVILSPLSFKSVVPKGAEGLSPFISGTDLRLTEVLSSESKSFRPGDAVKRTVRAELVGGLSLFIPTLIREEQVNGVSQYVSSPVTQDLRLDEEKKLIGIREESITYVFEDGGDFQFPKIELRYWDLDSETIQVASIKGRDLKVRKTLSQRLASSIEQLGVFEVGSFLLLLILLFLRWGYLVSLFHHAMSYVRASYSFRTLYLGGSVLLSSRSSAYRSVLVWADEERIELAKLKYFRDLEAQLFNNRSENTFHRFRLLKELLTNRRERVVKARFARREFSLNPK